MNLLLDLAKIWCKLLVRKLTPCQVLVRELTEKSDLRSEDDFLRDAPPEPLLDLARVRHWRALSALHFRHERALSALHF